MSKYILEADEITFAYLDGTIALNKLNIQIPVGKKVAVVGPNGAGKTTLFLHFNGVNRPARGLIKYKNEAINYKIGQLKELRKNIGVVFQDPDNQLFSASVYQDVSFGPLNLGWTEDKVRSNVERALKQTGSWDFREKPVHFLSYGQKKRTAIAGVLAMEPEVLILDEPTSGLDPRYCQEILNLLEKINRNGATVIISSHNIDEVYAWADYVYVLHQGKVLAHGEPSEVFQNQEAMDTANLIKPWVLEFYEKLLAQKIITEQSPLPRSKDELFKLLA